VTISERTAVLAAIDNAVREIRSLRSELLAALADHDERIRALESARAADQAVDADRADRRQTVTLSRRFAIAVAATLAVPFLGGLVELIRLFPRP
jgi:hypothetical protein